MTPAPARTPQPVAKVALTACAICRRALSDADSVALGIGPVCRKKAGYHFLTPAARKAANVWLEQVSRAASFGTDRDHRETLAVAADAINALASQHATDTDDFRGLTMLAGSMVEAFSAVVLKLDNERVYVRVRRGTLGGNTFYSEASTFHGYSWNGQRHTFPVKALAAVRELLNKHFAGKVLALDSAYYFAPEAFNQEVIDAARNVPAPLKPNVEVVKGDRVRIGDKEGVVFWTGADNRNADHRIRVGVGFGQRDDGVFMDSSKIDEVIERAETVAETSAPEAPAYSGRWVKRNGEWVIAVNTIETIEPGTPISVYTHKTRTTRRIPAGEFLGLRRDRHGNQASLVRAAR